MTGGVSGVMTVLRSSHSHVSRRGVRRGAGMVRRGGEG